MGERLLRELQLKAGKRVPEWQDLFLVEGGAGTGRTLAGSLQHHPSTLFVQLQIASAGNMATRNESSVWRSVKRSEVPFPLPYTLDGDQILTKTNALH